MRNFILNSCTLSNFPSHAVKMLNYVGLVTSRVSWVLCYRVIVPSWVRNFFSWMFRGSETFSLGCFVGPKFFLGGISWVQNFFSWVFPGSKIFSRWCFVDSNFFLVGVSWVQNFFSWVFLRSKIFSRGSFVGPKLFLVGILWGNKNSYFI